MIYLDHAATTPVHPRVKEAMLPYLSEVYGNPSSIHQWGRRARQALDEAREVIAGYLGVDENEIIFTSGGTESNNLALIGTALANRDKGRHIITSQIEHHAVLDTCAYLETLGFDVTYLPVDRTGKVSVGQLKEAVRPDTILVSIMFGNNEVGTIQDIAEIGEFLREKGVYFHSDGVQALGVHSIRLDKLPVDMMSFSAHKINGPKGVGALYVSKKVKLHAHIHGGNQERKRRAGTENVAGIVGFGESVKLIMDSLDENREKYRRFREAMIRTFAEAGIPFAVNGHPKDVLPHILNVSFPGCRTETLLMNLDLAGIAASSGSACTAGSLEISHVLKAMGLDEPLLQSAIRFSFGLGNTEEDVIRAARKTAELVKRAKNASH